MPSEPQSSLEAFDPDALVRVAFCSEANFSTWADRHGIEVEVSRIMYRTPRTPADELVGGIFHCGNRYFFQCIEGPAGAVHSFCHRIAEDRRHRQTTIQAIEGILERAFPVGSMSYVGMSDELKALQQRHGLTEFNPYRFSDELIRDFTALCVLPEAG
ncbi:MAG: BLUF domain-containing protein [Wenzhouxiangellaceae bacterium]|nr:BLUF domain-containing protein [Wenzhouxiangellaceae bacterium]